MLVIIAVLFVNACLAGTIPATPENITVTFLTPTTVRVAWQTMTDLNANPVEKYIVTYRPTNDRVIQDVAGDNESVILDRLTPSTQYSMTITAMWLGKKYRSSLIRFRTLDLPKNTTIQDFPPGIYSIAGGNVIVRGNISVNGSVFGDDVSATNDGPHELPPLSGVEVCLILMVLMMWAGAIALFFNRWGQIRMLLPYQPDFKHEQLKVPGSGTCAEGECNGEHSNQLDGNECAGCTVAHPMLHSSSRHTPILQEEPSQSLSERCTRSRNNSAIFVSSDGKGFNSDEFMHRHGSQSVFCRKAKSAENITNNARKKSYAGQRQWCTHDNNYDAADNTDSHECEYCELHTVSVIPSQHEPAPLPTQSNVTTTMAHATAITSANVVVGSYSLETPPSHIKDDEPDVAPRIRHGSGIATTDSIEIHNSNDTIDELIQIPQTQTRTQQQSHNHLCFELNPRILVHQRSSTTTSDSPPNSRSPSPIPLKPLQIITPKISAVPMVSVSGPSPTAEKPLLEDCL